MEKVIGIDFEDLIFMQVDRFEFVGLDYFGDELSVVILHFLKVLAGDVAEESEAVDELVEAKLEIGVHGEGEDQWENEIDHHWDYGEVTQRLMLFVWYILVVVQEKLVKVLHLWEIVE